MTGTPQQPPQQEPAPQAPQPAYQAPQPAYQAPQPIYQAPPAGPVPGKGLQVAGMVLGILSLVLAWLPIADLACGIIGLVLSVIGIRKASEVGAGKGMGIAGLVCSIIGVVWGAIHLILFFVVWAKVTEDVRRFRRFQFDTCFRLLRGLLRL